MPRRCHLLLWLPPLLLHSADARAWGLLTHVYFAQWLLWTLPLADPELRRAVHAFRNWCWPAHVCRTYRWSPPPSAAATNGSGCMP